MFIRTMTIGVAVLVLAAAPTSAQERGTIEFGTVGNRTFYDSSININDGWGLAGRIGAFIFPRLSVEFDVGRRFASRPLGLQSVEVEAFAARVVAVPLRFGSVSALAGAGFIHTDYAVGISDGIQGLLGAKWDIGRTVALRVDGLMDFNGDGTRNAAFQGGVSLYRHPAPIREPAVVATCPECPPTPTRRVDTVRVYVPFPSPPDTIVLRDTLVLEGVNFPFDESTLTPQSRVVLDDVARQLREPEWANVRFEVAGHTSAVGTAEYNMELSQRRAEAVRAYFVSRGISPDRMVARGYGQTQPIHREGREGDAWQNRRVELRRIP